MITIIRDVVDIPEHEISTLETGNWFELDKKIHIVIKNNSDDIEDPHVRCLNFTDNDVCKLLPETLIFLCSDVTLKYDINTERPEEP